MSNPPHSVLSSHLEIGISELNVQSLEVMTNFYVIFVGLEKLTESKKEILLGQANQPILKLVATPTLTPATTQSAGLYHHAIVFTSPAKLARSLYTLLRHQPTSFVGSADHLVSEAFYFTDPEGNGLELYHDRDTKLWQWQAGNIVMASNYLDPVKYIETHLDDTMDEQLKMGHLHLKVGNLNQAKAFYVDILGMSITATYPGALFVSDGKYHHHLGLNIWESAGAKLREPSLGLKRFTMRVAKKDDLVHLQKRLDKNELTYLHASDSITVKDPWGTEMSFTSAAP